MKPSEPAANTSDAPAVTLIQRLKDGSVHPSTLTKEQRLACVEIMYGEGYSFSQIAQLVERSEKTIKRDLADIAAKNALNPSAELARQIVGRIMLRSEAHKSRLMRLARGSEGSVGERVQAEYLAWQVEKDTTVLLQTLGYLPQRPQQVIGDVIHHVSGEEGELSFDQMAQRLQELESVTKAAGTFTPELAQQITALTLKLEHAKLAYATQQLMAQQPTHDNTEPSDGR